MVAKDNQLQQKNGQIQQMNDQLQHKDDQIQQQGTELAERTLQLDQQAIERDANTESKHIDIVIYGEIMTLPMLWLLGGQGEIAGRGGG